MKYVIGNIRHHHHSHYFCFSSSPSHHLYLLSFVPPHTVTPSGFSISPPLAPSLTNARNPEITTLQIGKSVNCRREEILVWSHHKSFVLEWRLVRQSSKGLRYIPSEKIGQKISPPPPKCFFDINYHHWISGNVFWPFLAPRDPQGMSRGAWGDWWDQIIVTFFRSQIWVPNCEISDCMNWKPKRDPPKAKNGPFGWNECMQKWIFL